jgi:hypothetical protein
MLFGLLCTSTAAAVAPAQMQTQMQLMYMYSHRYDMEAYHRAVLWHDTTQRHPQRTHAAASSRADQSATLSLTVLKLSIITVLANVTINRV